MNQKQLTILAIIIGLATLVVVLEISENHVSESDIFALTAFFSGAGAVIALLKTGGGD